MKRFIILAALAMIGAVSAFVIIRHPYEPMEVTAQPTEDGGVEMVPVTSAASTSETPDAETDEKRSLFVTYSIPSAFYDENISVELFADNGADIYFTLDGSDPDTNSERYSGAIDINAGTDTEAVTIKALAVRGDEKSEIFTRSYVVGQNVRERFSEDTLIFVLSTDPYNLYDYEYGIAVPGKIYDDYVKEHQGEEIPYNAPGNYYMSGREAERDIYVEVFESTGNKVISQAAGVRLSGGYSRVVDQKSLRLIARKEYDPDNGKFKYAFFDNAVDCDGQPISEFDRIVLRNGANDREFAGVRDELSQQLARDYGYQATQCTTPAAVFLNGEYYGFAWLHENYNEDYLESHFGGNKDQYEIVGNTEIPEEGTERGLGDYEKVVEYFDRDLTDDRTFAEFCELVDIKNFMQYYAMQIFISNKDWPGNNYKAFRYYPEEGEYIASEYMDGKWRYLFFDAEYAWGLYGEGFRLNTLSDLLDGTHMSGESQALNALLKREDMRELLADTLCDVMAGGFSTENILETLDMLIEKSDNEQMYALRKGITSTWANEWTFADSRDQIRKFAERRESVLRRQVAKLFEISEDTYDVSLSGAVGAEVRLGSQTTSGSVVFGSYYTAYGVDVSAETYEGYRFVKWDINGRDYSDRDVRITSDMAQDGRVSVRLVVEKEELHGVPLKISAISTDKKAGWLKLLNPNAEAVTAHGLYLSDDPEKPDRYALPEVTIGAGEELLIMMKNNKTTDALLQIQANFSLKEGETLTLSDSDGNILRSVEIPDIPEGGVYMLRADGKYYIK